MNGRVYDPELGRFLSADPFVKYPEGAQGLNRYSYVDNNPLSRVDPSGYGWLSKTWKKIKKAVKKWGRTIASIAIMFVPGLNIYAAGFLSGMIASGGNLKAGLIGKFTAGLFKFVGDLKLPFPKAVIAHGAVGGISSRMQGGSFKSGFLSGGFAKLSAPFTTSWGDVGNVVAASVAGGVGAELGGGKFANGAVTGAFSRMFNDLVHESRSALHNPRAVKKYAGDGAYQYRDVVSVDAVELTGMGKVLKWMARGLEVVKVSIQHGTRTHVNAIEYDVMLEDRLIQRDHNQNIIYESHVLRTTPTGQVHHEIPQDARFRQETHIRICVFSGAHCTD